MKLQFVGEDNVKNLSAVQNLIDMGKRKGAKAVYANYGMKLAPVLGKALPGVKVTVLGPPNLVQTEGIKTMKSRDKDEFWQLLAGAPRVAAALPLANGLARASTKAEAKPDPEKLNAPPQVRWFARRLAAYRGGPHDEAVGVVEGLRLAVAVVDDRGLRGEAGEREILAVEVGDEDVVLARAFGRTRGGVRPGPASTPRTTGKCFYDMAIW